eukprot:tig00000711_g3401.t1
MLPVEGQALLSVAAVSLISLVCLLFLATSQSVLDRILISLVAYSIGGLLGEVVFHMLPEMASREGGFSPTVCWILLAGFMFSFIFEKTLHVHGDEPKTGFETAQSCRISCVSCGETCGAEERKTFHPKAPCLKHNSCPPSPAAPGRGRPRDMPDSPRDAGPLLGPPSHGYGTLTVNVNGAERRRPSASHGHDREHGGHGHDHGHGGHQHWYSALGLDGWGSISPTAFIILLASTLHNVVDGVIIAGAFLTSPSLGVSTTIAVICHEIPHEIGDFAVLVHAGLSKKRAFFLNLFSAAFSVLGCGLYLALQGALERITPLLVPFACGTFMYVAAVDLVPHLLKSEERGASVLHFFVLVAGLVTMSELTRLEALLLGE